MKKSNRTSKSSKEKVLTKAQLGKLIREWQSVLSMHDWAIKATYNDPTSMPKPDAIGACATDQEHKRVRILLLHPKHFKDKGFQYTYKDFEHTVVHELLHGQFDCMDIPERRKRELEQVINLTAEAFIFLKYSNK